MAYGLVSLVDMFKNSGVCLRRCRLFQKNIFFSPVPIFENPMFVSTFEPYWHELRTARGSRNSIAVEKRALVGFPESRSAADQSLIEKIGSFCGWRIDGVCTTGVYKHKVYGHAMSSFLLPYEYLWVYD